VLPFEWSCRRRPDGAHGSAADPRRRPGHQIVAEAVDGQDAVQVVARHASGRRADGHPDAATRRPERDRGVPRVARPPRILVLTTFDADELVLEGLARRRRRIPAQGHPTGALVQAVRSVAAGQPMLVTERHGATDRGRRASGDDRGRNRPRTSPGKARRPDRSRGGGRPGRRARDSNRRSPRELFMSVATVKAHVGRLFTKLDVDNRVQIAILVHDAQKVGLAPVRVVIARCSVDYEGRLRPICRWRPGCSWSRPTARCWSTAMAGPTSR
jgi:hypothetical protein